MFAAFTLIGTTIYRHDVEASRLKKIHDAKPVEFRRKTHFFSRIGTRGPLHLRTATAPGFPRMAHSCCVALCGIVM